MAWERRGLRNEVTTALIACGEVKGSLAAAEHCEAVEKCLRAVWPDVEVIALPIAGGGGTVAAAISAGYREVSATVTGPTGEPVAATFALQTDGFTAVVEIAPATVQVQAEAAGPLGASCCGTSELVGAALDAGAKRIILAVGAEGTPARAGFPAAPAGRIK